MGEMNASTFGLLGVYDNDGFGMRSTVPDYQRHGYFSVLCRSATRFVSSAHLPSLLCAYTDVRGVLPVSHASSYWTGVRSHGSRPRAPRKVHGYII